MKVRVEEEKKRVREGEESEASQVTGKRRKKIPRRNPGLLTSLRTLLPQGEANS